VIIHWRRADWSAQFYLDQAPRAPLARLLSARIYSNSRLIGATISLIFMPDYTQMPGKHSRIARESRTIRVMVRLYCHRLHRGPVICPNCQELLDYAQERLEKCPYQEGKTTCAKCPVHCYKQEMRAKIRAVMRYCGPRMIYHHPLMAIQHLIDGRRKGPEPISR
jgi:hypothetical protein